MERAGCLRAPAHSVLQASEAVGLGVHVRDREASMSPGTLWRVAVQQGAFLLDSFLIRKSLLLRAPSLRRGSTTRLLLTVLFVCGQGHTVHDQPTCLPVWTFRGPHAPQCRSCVCALLETAKQGPDGRKGTGVSAPCARMHVCDHAPDCA